MREPRRDWFAGVRREFAHAASRFKGQPITYVEIGCWCGDSAKWVMDNIVGEGGHGYGLLHLDPQPPPEWMEPRLNMGLDGPQAAEATGVR